MRGVAIPFAVLFFTFRLDNARVISTLQLQAEQQA